VLAAFFLLHEDERPTAVWPANALLDLHLAETAFTILGLTWPGSGGGGAGTGFVFEAGRACTC